MTSRVSHTTFDCRDAFELSTWWKQVLGYIDLPDDPNGVGDEECMILHPTSGHRLLFDRRNPDGTGWTVLADPDGNHFCILRSDEERARTS